MKNTPPYSAEDALIKIKALADAASFLTGSDQERSIALDLLEIITNMAELGQKL
ncbi:hypothetical protein V2154_10670 [Ewingella sp. CoE-038-23]|uniref:hypothetical protein n=1 Tax=Ewingella docleensis TaxID=3118588 RepID=UPI0033654244